MIPRDDVRGITTRPTLPHFCSLSSTLCLSMSFTRQRGGASPLRGSPLTNSKLKQIGVTSGTQVKPSPAKMHTLGYVD